MKYFVYCRKSTESEDRQILSLDSQLAELNRAFGHLSEITIVATYREAASAKAPGRPLLNEMLARIEKGEAEGILAWHPDRLARNSVDGGRIIYLLDRRILKELRFATFTFENNPQGKFMLSITFGYSKYYVDTLSENVKRGNRMKIERGWRPNLAPLGYLNKKDDKTITKDPVRFPLVRQMFDLMLTGSYNPKEIARLARDEWGMTTVRKKRSGGNPFAVSTIYRTLSNAFYAGLIPWNGQVFPGKHEAMLTLDEFERVQVLLGRPGRPRPREARFAFTGMMRCGACGLMITAEIKTNRHGRRYTYYHCTKRALARCPQPSVDLKTLEDQIGICLKNMFVPARTHQVAAKQLQDEREDEKKLEAARLTSIERTLNETTAQLSELTGLRLRNLIGDEEFIRRQQGLQQDQIRLAKKRDQVSRSIDRFELLGDVFFFRNRAPDWFQYGDRETKRLILETIGSNLTLKDKVLSLQARKPFARFIVQDKICNLSAVVDDVLTALRDDPEEAAIIRHNIRILRDRFERGKNLLAA